MWLFIIIMTHGRPWRVDHLLTINVMWLHFDQSAKQLIVGHTTMLSQAGAEKQKKTRQFSYRAYWARYIIRKHIQISVTCRNNSRMINRKVFCKSGPRSLVQQADWIHHNSCKDVSETISTFSPRQHNDQQDDVSRTRCLSTFATQIRSHDFWRYINLYVCTYSTTLTTVSQTTNIKRFAEDLNSV